MVSFPARCAVSVWFSTSYNGRAHRHDRTLCIGVDFLVANIFAPWPSDVTFRWRPAPERADLIFPRQILPLLRHAALKLIRFFFGGSRGRRSVSHFNNSTTKLFIFEATFSRRLLPTRQFSLKSPVSGRGTAHSPLDLFQGGFEITPPDLVSPRRREQA